MTVMSGFDSVVGPSLTVGQEARAGGASFWFGYLGGPGAFRAWLPSEWSILRAAGLTPGCVWVPTYGLAEDPAQAAADAVGAATQLGIYGSVTLDTEEQMRADPGLDGWVDTFCATVESLGRPCPVYTGAGYTPAGQAGFAPNWGSTAYPSAGQAVQYGPGTRYGMSVDVDLADPGFPLGSWVKPQPPGPPTPPTPILALKENEMALAYAGSIQYLIGFTSAGLAAHPLPGGTNVEAIAAAGTPNWGNQAALIATLPKV